MQQNHQNTSKKGNFNPTEDAKRQKKDKNGMVDRQNVPIHLKWATMLPTLRTTALGGFH